MLVASLRRLRWVLMASRRRLRWVLMASLRRLRSAGAGGLAAGLSTLRPKA
jgi:hypothetical protein